MNSALVGMLTNFLNKNDAKKEKEDDRRYREQLIADERAYDEMRDAETRSYNKGEKIEGRQYQEGREELHRKNALEDEIKRNAQTYRDAYDKFEKIYPQVKGFFPTDYTPEQAFIAAGKNSSLPEIERAAQSFSNLTAGRPASSAAAGVASDKANRAIDTNKETVARTLAPRMAEQAQAEQNKALLDARTGGSLVHAVNSPFYPSIDTGGGVSMIKNPSYDAIRSAEKGSTGMEAFGPNGALIAGANQVGMPMYEKKLDPFGRPVAVVATPTPSTSPSAPTKDISRPTGIITPGPIRANVPRGYEGYATDIINATPPRTQNEIDMERASLFEKMKQDYLMRQRQPQRLVWPQ